MKKLITLALAWAILFGAASMIFAAAPGGMNTPAASTAAPAGAARGTWDDFFRSPATPQDMALSGAIVSRLQQWKDPALAQSPATQTGPGSPCALCGVTVEARNGCIRLSGRVSSLQHRMAAENLARNTQGTASVINAITTGN
jgi:hypothetical protein